MQNTEKEIKWRSRKGKVSPNVHSVVWGSLTQERPFE